MGLRKHQSGSTLFRLGVQSSIDYTLTCFADYLRYADVDAEFLAGKHVLEVGPGDSLGIALCFLANGAASVTALDGFEPRRDAKIVREVQAGVLAAMPAKGRERARTALARW